MCIERLFVLKCRIGAIPSCGKMFGDFFSPKIRFFQTKNLVFFISRIKQLLETDNPVFERYTAEADPLFLDNCGKTTREIMHDMITVRKEMAAEMLAFPESLFNRTATHPVLGTMTLLQWINFFLLHEAHHLFAIFKLKAALQKAITE